MFAGPLASAIAVGAIGTVVLFVLNGNYYDSVFEVAICYSIVVVGMVLQIGYTAQLAFSQSVFMGFGAYGVAVLNLKFGWNVPLAGVVVLAVALLLSALIGVVCTRAPGFSLALATLFFSAIAIGFVGASNYLGATTGLGGIARDLDGRFVHLDPRAVRPRGRGLSRRLRVRLRANHELHDRARARVVGK